MLLTPKIVYSFKKSKLFYSFGKRLIFRNKIRYDRGFTTVRDNNVWYV
jgi:hypothetical protein